MSFRPSGVAGSFLNFWVRTGIGRAIGRRSGRGLQLHERWYLHETLRNG